MKPIILGCIIICVVIISFILKQIKLSRKLKILRNSWGKARDNSIDIESAKILFILNRINKGEFTYCIDDNTWHDLDCDEIFKLINHTVTPIGSQNLYFLLRHPVLKKEMLNNREEHISNFFQNSDLREKLQLSLLDLESSYSKYLPFLLWEPLPEKPAYARLLPFMSIISAIILILALLNILHFSIPLVVYVINLVIRSYAKRKIEAFIYSFQYLCVLINTAEKVSSLKFDEIKEIQNILRDCLKGTKSIARRLFALKFDETYDLMEYFSIYFLWDISGFYLATNKIKQHLCELRTIYETIGRLDALLSIASFRVECQQSCQPSFSAKENKYIVEDIYHPLLMNPISNSFQFESRNIIISGSNMSGKTTFLKTMGINAILAQTINLCMAKRYTAPLLKVRSSILREESLLLGKSYYFAEIESILKMLNASNRETIHLFILDEIFRGTNSTERLAASIEVLKYLGNQKDFTLVATHDMQLCQILMDKYQNYHFREKVDEEGITFDYKLQKGVSKTRNAIALLKNMSYPDIIIKNAIDHIKNGCID